MPDIGIRVVVLGVAEARRNVAAFQSDVTRTESTLRGLSGVAENVGTSMTRFGTALSGIGRSLSLTVTAPIVALTGSLVEAGIKFEDAFAGVGKTVNGILTPMGELTELGKEVRDEFRLMALDIPLATNDIASLGEVVGQLGVQADSVAEVTELVAMLGATTELSAEDAATSLIRFGNIMEGTALDVEDFIRRAGSSVVALGNASVSTEGEILNLSLRLAAAGDRANFSSQEILAWATTLSDLGVRSEMGGTAVSRAITEMLIAVQTGGKNLETFAAVSGKSVDQFVHDFETDASNALLSFIQNLEKGIRVGDVNKAMLLDMGLSGVRAIDVIGRLGDATGIFARNLETSERAWREQIALQEEFNKRTATIQSQIQLLKNRFTDLGITIFDLVRNDILALINGISQAIDWFKNLDPEVQRNILQISALVAAIGPALIIIGGLVAALGAIITAATALLSPIGLATAAVLALGAAVGLALGPDLLGLVQPTIETLIGDINDLLEQSGLNLQLPTVETPELPELPNDFLERQNAPRQQPPGSWLFDPNDPIFSQQAQQIAPDFLERQGGTEEVTGLKAVIQDLISPEILDMIDELREKAVQSVKEITAAIEGFSDIVSTSVSPELKEAFAEWDLLLGEWGLTWKDILLGVVELIGSTVIAILSFFGGLAVALAAAFLVISQVWNNVWTSLKMIFDGILEVFENFVTAIIHLARGEFEAAGQDFVELLAGLGKIIVGAMTLILSIVGGAVSLILAIILGFAEGVLKIWGHAFQMISKETGDRMLEIANTIGQMKDDVINIFDTLVKETIKFFQNLFHELVGGSIIPDMVDAIIAEIERLDTTFRELIETLINGVITRFTELHDGVVAKVASIAEKVTNLFVSLTNRIVNEIIPGWIKGMLSHIQAFRDQFLGIVQSIAAGIDAEFVNLQARLMKIVMMIIQKLSGLEDGFKSLAIQANVSAHLLGRAIARIIEALDALWGMDQKLRGSPQYSIYYAFEDLGKLLNSEGPGIASSIGSVSQALSNMDVGSINNTNNNVTNNVDKSMDINVTGVPLTGEFDLISLLEQRLTMVRDGL